MAANSFVNGFMGGMGAVNQMLDSKARREHYAWQKETAMEDRALKEQERQKLERINQLNATMHVWQNMKPENKKKLEQTYFDTWNKNPAFQAAMDNNNPNETAVFSGVTFAKDPNGHSMVVPKINVYDVNDKEQKTPLRSGRFSQRREAGGAVLGMPMEDFMDLAASDAGLDPLLATQAEILKLGGKLPESSATFGPLTQRGDSYWQQNKKTGEWFRKGDMEGGTSGTKGKGKNGSGTGGGTWKNYQTREIHDTSYPDDPSKMMTEMVQYRDNDDGTVSIRGIVDTGGGKMKITEYGVTQFNQQGQIVQPGGGLAAMGLTDEPAPTRTEKTESSEKTDTTKKETTPKKEDTKPENTPEETPVPIVEQAAAPPVNPVAMGGRGAYGAIAQDPAIRAQLRRDAQLKWLQTLEEMKKNKPIRPRPTNYAAGMSAIRPGGMQ